MLSKIQQNILEKNKPKTPMEQLIQHIDPINSGILSLAEKLLEEERKQFIQFGQMMYNKGYVDSYSGTLKKSPAEKFFNMQYEKNEVQD